MAARSTRIVSHLVGGASGAGGGDGSYECCPCASASTDSATIWKAPDADLNILPEARAMEQEVVDMRRQIHMNPELKFEEVETAKLIVSKLSGLEGFDIRTGVGITGVCATLTGRLSSSSNRCIGLRADMDGLPQTEANDLPYKSKVVGKMHTCGHDGHVAMLLGAAMILHKDRHKLRGSVKFIFQPAEEGGAGALAMIKDGALENPHVTEMYGLHLWNYSPLYSLGIGEGPFMAASDSFEIEIQGAGGHGAAPSLARDVIVAGGHLVTQLQSIVSRSIRPGKDTVITVGTFNAGTSHNIIADKAKMTGTIRTFSAYTRSVVLKRIDELCEGVSKSFNVKCKRLAPHTPYPAVNNKTPSAIENVRKAAAATFGSHRVFRQKKLMGAEDYSFFLNERPGAFFMLGTSIELRGKHMHHHSPEYILNEDCLVGGTSFWVTLIRNLLADK